jgi:diaminohydroxyphosphoribosylaminopyrimidine deaminase/5-amino-6-(5-phosphoribosylamino)uracil reductase
MRRVGSRVRAPVGGRDLSGATAQASTPTVSDAISRAFVPFELEAMARAAAESRRGTPSPNPPVGAAVVRDGAVVGVGHHRRVGDDHAEVMALREAGEQARGATVFVTLEPCNHHGRTAPCTEALLRAGVARVVFAVADPNPHVRGHGRDALRAAGVVVEVGFDPEAQRAVEHGIAPWMRFITSGRAHVTLKAATTRGGESQWITSPEARRDGHLLRARCDAVMVGSGTARADDPMLTVREVHIERAPVRVVVARGADLALDAKLVTTAREVPTWLLCATAAEAGRRGALAAAGVRVLAVAAGDDGAVDLGAGLRALAAEGIVSVLCEGGGGLHGALRDAGLVDRVVFYVAPTLLGGGALHAVGGRGAGRLADATRLHDWSVRPVGPDLRIEAEVR